MPEHSMSGNQLSDSMVFTRWSGSTLQSTLRRRIRQGMGELGRLAQESSHRQRSTQSRILLANVGSIRHKHTQYRLRITRATRTCGTSRWNVESYGKKGRTIYEGCRHRGYDNFGPGQQFCHERRDTKGRILTFPMGSRKVSKKPWKCPR